MGRCVPWSFGMGGSCSKGGLVLCVVGVVCLFLGSRIRCLVG